MFALVHTSQPPYWAAMLKPTNRIRLRACVNIHLLVHLRIFFARLSSRTRSSQMLKWNAWRHRHASGCSGCAYNRHMCRKFEKEKKTCQSMIASTVSQWHRQSFHLLVLYAKKSIKPHAIGYGPCMVRHISLKHFLLAYLSGFTSYYSRPKQYQT